MLFGKGGAKEPAGCSVPRPGAQDADSLVSGSGGREGSGGWGVAAEEAKRPQKGLGGGRGGRPEVPWPEGIG